MALLIYWVNIYWCITVSMNHLKQHILSCTFQESWAWSIKPGPVLRVSERSNISIAKPYSFLKFGITYEEFSYWQNPITCAYRTEMTIFAGCHLVLRSWRLSFWCPFFTGLPSGLSSFQENFCLYSYRQSPPSKKTEPWLWLPHLSQIFSKSDILSPLSYSVSGKSKI